jgi:D-proline reductase (dithiol) PrdB
MPVDSFKYLPRLIGAIYETTDVQKEIPIPWTPLERPISECTFGLVTSGGLYQRGVEPPFDLQRERLEPTWGDPTYRTIPKDITSVELSDINVLLPVHRFDEFSQEGRIAGISDHHYSFMGYQGYPPDTTAWREIYAPAVAEKFKSEGVQCVLLTPN